MGSSRPAQTGIVPVGVGDSHPAMATVPVETPAGLRADCPEEARAATSQGAGLAAVGTPGALGTHREMVDQVEALLRADLAVAMGAAGLALTLRLLHRLRVCHLLSTRTPSGGQNRARAKRFLSSNFLIMVS